jgi:hypothetical protein
LLQAENVQAHMSLTAKQQFIEAFFQEFEQKAERLQKLWSQSYVEDAFTLCLVYIDRLASGRYGGKYGHNRENYWRALKELSGNPLFGMIHPLRLVEQTRAKYPSAVTLIESIVASKPHELLEEDMLTGEIRASSLTAGEKAKLISTLWRASIANISYDHIRNAEVHGSGSGGLSFDESIYQGKVGVTLDFQVLYDALRAILHGVKEASIKASQWFANPNYMKERT